MSQPPSPARHPESPADWIAHHARYSPRREAVHDLASGRRYTYSEFDERVSRAALWLRDRLGAGRGDRVAVLSHNDSDVFEVQFACQRLGAIFLPLNWRLATPELEFICGDAKPRAFLYGAEFEEAAAAVARTCAIEHVAALANGGPSDYETGLEGAAGSLTDPGIELGDTWTIMYTSGTTGRPKGARNTYRMGLYNTMNSVVACAVGPGTRNLVFLPTFHTGGLNVYANPVFHTGGTNVVMRTFDPGRFLHVLSDRESPITHALGVPTNFLMTAEEPGFDDADLDHLVLLGVGGAPAPLALLERYARKGTPLQQLWGMTETGPLGLVLDAEHTLSKAGSSGLPVMYSELKVVDGEGRTVGPDETGELMIRGPNVTPGYWNRPEANRDSFTGDGWFHTGDAARVDGDGYFYIVDRWKDMFISGGENVYPVEVENAIYELDGVLENAVVGVPDSKWGEVGRVYVVLKGGSNLDGGAILEHCRDRIARYKVPKEVRFLDELPHNATGKILKHALPRD